MSVTYRDNRFVFHACTAGRYPKRGRSGGDEFNRQPFRAC